MVIFFAELFGTFGLLVAATGSIVYDDRVGKTLGIVFITIMHFIGLSLMIYLFGKYSMAHFNPAVTIGYFIAGYVNAKKILVYISAQTIGAFLGSIFVKYVIGNHARLGINYPNYQYPIPLFSGIEVLATMFLMGSILIAVNIKGLSPVFVSWIIAGTVALDVFFFGSISGASMNPMRSLVPAVLSGFVSDLWLYWSAPFVGASLIALIYKKKFSKFN
jgi:aquaporin Z